MSESEKKMDASFFQLTVSLQMAAMQQMGKIASPVSGKIEKNLEQARVSIDMLAMIAEKTDGNLTPDEKDLIDRVLFELRMNFVDETKKSEEGPAEGEEKEAEGKKQDEISDDGKPDEKNKE